MASINPLAEAARLAELWSPRVLARVNDQYVKVAKVKGSLTWHAHAEEDELFYVLSGHLTLELEGRPTVELDPGEFFVVPKGLRHNPLAKDETLVLLVETVTTQHTGDVVMEKTRSIAEQLKESGEVG
jgi:quercetin dioxygenase-like cupin family protein